MTPSPAPPRWAEALLTWVLPGGTTGESILADLEQEFLEIAARTTMSRARRWYRWESLKVAAHFTWGALTPAREHRGSGRMERTRRNVGLALRRVLRSPGFSAVAVLTIALGIGANVGIFSVVNAVLLEPLPYHDAERLVAIWEWHQPRDRQRNVANPGNYMAWRDGSESFESMTAISIAQPATVTVGGEPEELMVQYAAIDFFSVLGFDAALGRTFDLSPDQPEPVEAVISHRYWQNRLGGSDDVIGQTIRVNASNRVVVGVLPPDYVVFGESTDVWASTVIDGDQTNSGRWLTALGRLADGVSFDVAAAELQAISVGLEEQFPDFNSGWTAQPIPLQEDVVGDVQSALWVLLGAVGLLLLIACANVANLFLVQGTERRREMAIRSSLGASTRVLASQLFTESVLIAGLGAVLGVGLAHVGTRWAATNVPEAFALPRVDGATVDGGVLGFAVLLTLGTALLFGLLPAVQAVRASASETLNAEARGPSRRTSRVRNGLVVAEVAVSILLLATASLFGRSFTALRSVDSGIEPEHVLVGRVNLSGEAYRGDGPKVAFFDEMMNRLSSQPGVEYAGGITFLPMDGVGAGTSYWPIDRPQPSPEDRRVADIRNVTGDYFQAMGLNLLQGRGFDSRDRADAPQTVVVNQSLAVRYWPGESAVGKQVVINWLDHTPWEIIGVIQDVRMAAPDVAPREGIYINYAKATFFPWMHVVVRASGDPLQLTSTMRTTLASLDETLPLGSVRTMESIVGHSVARPRMTSLLMAVFAGLATVLAAVGLYGVLAFAVSQRAREIGVRVALGAQPIRVLGMVVRQGFGLVVVGLVIGIGLAVAGTRILESLLFGISPFDPISFGLAGTILFVVALLACAIPAWRASRVAPADALRAD